ncbi:unnamed protein product, partial [Rotaria sp. Silwood1]
MSSTWVTISANLIDQLLVCQQLLSLMDDKQDLYYITDHVDFALNGLLKEFHQKLLEL